MWSLRKMKMAGFLAVAIAGPAMASPALAQDFTPGAGDVALRAGPAAVFFDSSAKFEILGTSLAGADLKASNGMTLSVEAEVYVIQQVSLAVTVGIPPKSKVNGRGILEPVGRLGKVKYGLGSAIAKYHFNQSGAFQPFIGGGAAHFVSFREYDAAVTNLQVDSSWGPAVQAGAEYMLTDHIGLYASATHSWLKTDGTGTFSGLPISARVTLDPTALQGGLLFRF